MCQWHQWIIQIFPTKLKEKTHFTTFHFRTVLGCKLHVPLQLAGASVAHRCCVGAISVELSSQNGTKLRTPNNSCKILACIFRVAPEQAHDLAASLKCIHLRVNCEISHKMHVTLSLRKQTPFCCFDCQRLPGIKACAVRVQSAIIRRYQSIYLWRQHRWTMLIAHCGIDT